MAQRRPLVNVSGDVSELPAADHLPGLTKGLSIQSPTASEKVPIFYTTVALTLAAVQGIVLGTTPSVTYTIKTGSDMSAAGTSIATDTVTTGTGGEAATIQNSGTVAANSWVWLETSAMTGTVNMLSVTLRF